MSITIHHLVLPSSSDFDQPHTEASAQWKTALLFIAAQNGWFESFWGRHLESPERMLLLVDWRLPINAAAFLEAHYTHFAELLAPLLAQNPPEPPEAATLNLNQVYPGAWPGGGISTVYRNSFSTLDAESQRDLLGCTFNMYVQDLDLDESEATEGYTTFARGWVVDPATGQNTKKLYLLIAWESLEAEQNSDENHRTTDGRRVRDVQLQHPVLDKADEGGERFHVGWEMVSKNSLGSWRKRNEC